jgi:hypothetical protein
VRQHWHDELFDSYWILDDPSFSSKPTSPVSACSDYDHPAFPALSKGVEVMTAAIFPTSHFQPPNK